MEMVRCKHFSIEAEEIYVTGAPIMLRVPIRRCALAERMIGYISHTARGSQVARKLRISHPQQHDAHPAPSPADHTQQEGGADPSAAVAKEAAKEEQIRAAFGPDLEAIHHLECTGQRCKESCTPAYKQLLEHFDLHELAEQETGAGCLGAGD